MILWSYIFYSKGYENTVLQPQKIAAKMKQVGGTHGDGCRCLGRVTEMSI